MIYHITTEQDWSAYQHDHDFVPNDYHREGFIHCCTASQLTGVRQRYFKGKAGLVLLHLDETKLKPELKYEASTNDEKFPHLYGPINKEAIMTIEQLSID